MTGQPEYLLDADAVINLHSLGLIDALCTALRAGVIVAHCTRYVWNVELNALPGVRKALEEAGMQVHPIDPKSPAGETFRRMLRERGNLGRNSKGENELVAFAQHSTTLLTLVARDAGARRMAEASNVASLDLCQFVCELVVRSAIDEAVALEALSVWENPHAGNGRPRDFVSFSDALARRRQERPSS